MDSDKPADKVAVIRNEAIRLQKTVNFMKKQHENERAEWKREREELISQLSKERADHRGEKRMKKEDDKDNLPQSQVTEVKDEPLE